MNHYSVTSGSGGSSYVSGHPGCIAVNENSSNDDDITFLESSIHSSSYYFVNTYMLSGDATILEPDRTYAKGHSGSGCAKLTFLDPQKITCEHHKSLHFSLLAIIIYKQI